jgi:phosphoenolpyruvate phosphomutase
VAAMQKTARTLKEHEHLLSIEDKVAPVSEIFRLQNAAELQEAEDRYLPRGAEDTCAMVLAASRGDELGELTEHQPKTMVKIQGAPILSHIVDAYHAVGIKDIVVVRGYKKEAVNLPNLTYVDNEDFAETGELDSLLKALQSRDGYVQSTIISYGDVLFNKYIPQSLCQETDDCVIFVDSNWREQTSYARLGGFTECTIPNSRKAFNAKIYLNRLGNDIPQESIHGVWMGFLKVSPSAAGHIIDTIVEMLTKPANRKAGIPQLLQELLKRQYPVRVLYTVGHWLDINSIEDVVQAGNF